MSAGPFSPGRCRRSARAPLAGLLAVALALTSAGEAAGQRPPQPEPVVGGGSFNAAPLLEPGAYRDTILAREVLYYAVELSEGQGLVVDLRPEADLETLRERIGDGVLGVDVYDPLRQPVEVEQSPSVVSPDTPVTVTQAEPVAASEVAAEESAYPGPGVWYLTVTARSPSFEGTPLQVPFSFTLETGEGASAPAPDTTTAETAPGAETPSEAESDSADEGDGDGDGLAPALLAAVLVGALIGSVGTLVRRRVADGG